jgi:hypothetical protein
VQDLLENAAACEVVVQMHKVEEDVSAAHFHRSLALCNKIHSERKLKVQGTGTGTERVLFHCYSQVNKDLVQSMFPFIEKAKKTGRTINVQ